ncbi:hypothetical protein A3K78_05225 [Candidatus Bathyarchaeota archaeon RBG_13_52_12]|nr:MAG: hypothetical protein A3K78_05225 [Candidatus Bathyarchaeota archaeon RBG_13_52_12]
MVSEEGLVEKTNLLHLQEINNEAEKFHIDLILIGGNAVRAYTEPRSWRFTKDLDFITTSENLNSLHSMFSALGYSLEKTEYGVLGRKSVTSKYSIELHISVDKVIDWSTGETYLLPRDIFQLSKKIQVKGSIEENRDTQVPARCAPIEDMLIMKLLTERPRDHFDSAAIILDSFDEIDLNRFKKICQENELTIINERIRSLIIDNRKGVIANLWRENTGLTLTATRRNDLRKKLNTLLNL